MWEQTDVSKKSKKKQENKNRNKLQKEQDPVKAVTQVPLEWGRRLIFKEQ